jgi:hypothetical protein
MGLWLVLYVLWAYLSYWLARVVLLGLNVQVV